MARLRFFMAALSAAIVLAGCDASLETKPVAAPTEAPVLSLVPPNGFPDAYTARNDGEFSVPALPVAEINPQFQRQVVDFPGEDAPGTIVINPSARSLHLVISPGKAIRYGIAVGRAGFEWSGEALVTNRRNWPTWTPPKEMIERSPKLAKWENGQPGGPDNPLGARALYLTTNGVDYGYRIHGTPEWRSIGSNASSGCIRMINQDVMDLYDRVPDGARVVVLNRDGSRPTGLNLPPPAPKKTVVKKAAAPKPVIVPAGVAKITLPTAAPNFGAIIPPAPAAAVPAAVTTPAVDPAPVQPSVTSTAPAAPAISGSATAPLVILPAPTTDAASQ